MEGSWEVHAACPQLDVASTKGRFAGYVAVVAGGGSGIGKACARRLLSDGAKVAVMDVNIDGLEDLACEYGPMLTTQRVDVTRLDECKAAADAVARASGGIITTLINSVAYFGSKGLLDAKHGDWEKTLSVNVEGYANMVQACLPSMIAASKENNCSIVNMSSISAHAAQPNRWTYAASKGAVHTLTKCMALDLARHSIRVNSLSPSWIWTPEVAKAAQNDRPKYESVWQKFFMLRRLGEVEEVAAATCFLCSGDASYITGVDLPCDGGYLSMGPESHGETSAVFGSTPSS